MSDVKSVKINDDARDVKDALAREHIGDVSELHTSDKTTLVGAINEVFDNDSDDDGKIGDLSNLMTDSKSNLVGAVNEVYQNADNANDAIGDLSNLTTQNKGNLVGAVNELANDIDNTKDDVLALTARVGLNNSRIGNLTNLHTTDKDNLVEAINETLDSVGDIGDVNLPDLTNIQNTVDAINGVIAQTNSDLTTLTNRVQSDEGDIAQNTSDIGSLETAVGDVELVTDAGYTDLSDAVKQIHDTLDGVSTNLYATDERLGTNGNLTEPYADQIAANMNHIGNMSQLDVNGRDLVDACNYLQTMIGTLSNLSTTDKTSLVAAINEVAQSGGGSGGSGGSGSTLIGSYNASSSDTYASALNALYNSLTAQINSGDVCILDLVYANTTHHEIYLLSAIDQNRYTFQKTVGSGTSQSNAVVCVDKMLVSDASLGSTMIRVTAYTKDYADYGASNIGECSLKVYKIGGGSGSGGKTEVASVQLNPANATTYENAFSALATALTVELNPEKEYIILAKTDNYTFKKFNLLYCTKYQSRQVLHFGLAYVSDNLKTELETVTIMPNNFYSAQCYGSTNGTVNNIASTATFAANTTLTLFEM